ncbi:MAG: MobA/MobL family protein [Clostridiales bacterium]|jgi:hypothetical protein|nr:MobA/MobL family protein [Clostridiales bacterium]
MAIFHSHLKVITRGKGKSAVAAAAYQAGEIIKNEHDGVVHDYTRKGGVVHAEILLPGHAPAEYKDRAILWNAVEKVEKSSDAQLARSIDIALPVELTREQNITLVRRYVGETFVNAGMCADLCVHDKGDGNPHAHIMLTMRPITENGRWGGKQKKEYILDDNGGKIYDPAKRQYKCRSIPSTNWNNRGNADKWRKAWEDVTNAELERLGFDSRIDRRTYAEQGIEQKPTVHMGVAAMQMERRGIRTERGDINRAVENTNKEIRQLRARINKLEKNLADLTETAKQTTAYDVIFEIMSPNYHSAVARLKNAAAIYNFCHENDINTVRDLDRVVRRLQSDLHAVGEDMKKTSRRIDTLEKHLEHSYNYRDYRKYNARYEKLYAEDETARKETGLFAKSRAQKALDAANDYYESHRMELTLCNAAEKYLRDVLQERFDPKKLPPIKAWEKELADKTVERQGQYRKYSRIKDNTTSADKIQRAVRDAQRDDDKVQMRQKSRGVER